MRLLDLSLQIFKNFSEVKTYFAVGKFNLSLADKKVVLKEKSELLKNLTVPANQLAVLSQVHSSKIIYFPDNDNINFFTQEPLEADGMYTDQPGIFMAIRSADCLPILFCNKSTNVVGAIHAGWRGTRNEIIKIAIQEINNKFPTSLSEFYFYLGPAAQVCCYDASKYQNDPDIMNYFREELVIRDDKLFLDFVAANIRQLRELGIKDDQIENSGICTIHNFQYPSYRREKEKRKQALLSVIGF